MDFVSAVKQIHSFIQTSFVLIFTYGFETWTMIKGVLSQMQAADMHIFLENITVHHDTGLAVVKYA